ncbi:hypothetical protein WJX82_006222 [Trebouxia sp. C0006]
MKRFCWTHASRCNIRSLLSTAWAHLQGLAEYVYTIIIHGKAIGVHRNQAHQCCIADGAATFNVECLHAQVVASQ